MPETGAGYNIPISVSAASTFSVPQTQNSPSYINFGSNVRQGGDIEQNPQNINPATAVSSASQRDASASSQGSGVESILGAGSDSGFSTTNVVVIGAAVVLVALIIGAAIYFRK